jgi:hypothetical protein
MKTKPPVHYIHCFCVMVLLLGVSGLGSLQAKDATAFDLIKEGNKHVGEHAKDKVVQIRSEKSIGGLTPNIWYVVYYDTTATLKASEVKFGAGKFMDLKRPVRLLEPITGAEQPMDKDKLKVDSDKALKLAANEPLLEKIELKASKLKLEREDGVPTWKVRLYAAKLKRPTEDADIGEVYITADEGKVVKTDLHINRLD